MGHARWQDEKKNRRKGAIKHEPFEHKCDRQSRWHRIGYSSCFSMGWGIAGLPTSRVLMKLAHQAYEWGSDKKCILTQTDDRTNGQTDWGTNVNRKLQNHDNRIPPLTLWMAFTSSGKWQRQTHTQAINKLQIIVLSSSIRSERKRYSWTPLKWISKNQHFFSVTDGILLLPTKEFKEINSKMPSVIGGIPLVAGPTGFDCAYSWSLQWVSFYLFY